MQHRLTTSKQLFNAGKLYQHIKIKITLEKRQKIQTKLKI